MKNTMNAIISGGHARVGGTSPAHTLDPLKGVGPQVLHFPAMPLLDASCLIQWWSQQFLGNREGTYGTWGDGSRSIVSSPAANDFWTFFAQFYAVLC